jgi:DNA-binding transcriptional regulator YdaS (Cro superfamily)
MEQQITPFEALQLAVDTAGGQSALARICSVSQTAVWKWLQSAKRLPAEYVLMVEAATGVSRHALRPDIYPLETVALPASAIAEPTPLCGPILSQRGMAGHGKTPPTLDRDQAA